MGMDLFANIATTSLGGPHREAIVAAVRDGDWRLVFPSGSSSPPPLLVGRTEQAARINSLAAELTRPPEAARSIHGVVLFGPRGVGKTALLNILANELPRMAPGLVQTIRLSGSNLSSAEDLAWEILRRTPEGTEKVKTTRRRIGIKMANLSVTTTTSPDRRGSAPGSAAPSVLFALDRFGSLEGGGRAPALICVDEAHVSHPMALTRLLEAAQTLNGASCPVAVALAGTPDVLDVLRLTEATWFLDRAQDERLLPVGNLTDGQCALAVADPLATAGVAFERDRLREAAGWCRGSPYFTQALGSAAMAVAFEGSRRADFSADGPVRAAFLDVAQRRYSEAWTNIDRVGLTGCARQLGALWRWSRSGEGRLIHEEDVEAAVLSGLNHPPTHKSPTLSGEEAGVHFRHLGLLWSPSGNRAGPWELGLPSFFAYVESVYQSRANRRYHETLDALVADEASIVPPDPSPGRKTTVAPDSIQTGSDRT